MSKGITILLILTSYLAGMIFVDAMNITNVSIVEGFPIGGRVHEITECSRYNGRSDVYRSREIGNEQTATFDTYFTYSDAIITARQNISRDDIAYQLGHPHKPVVFEVTCYIYMLGSFALLDSHTIYLEILDLNNHRPTFARSALNINITERDDDNGFHTLGLAIDADQGVNSTQHYYLEPPRSDSSPFGLEVRRNPDTMLVTDLRLLIGVLDREVQSSYELVLYGSENSTNRTATATINITVLDVCDESPMFPMSRFQASVLENSPAGTTVLTNVTATDNDILDEGQIRYRISAVCSIEYEDRPCITTPSPFRLDRERGDLTLILDTDTIDREQFIKYEVSIIAEDSCGRPATATVEVAIGNINDNPPIVDVYGLRNVLETRPVNSTILLVVVSDLDYGRNQELPQFSITLKEDSGGMLVDTDTFYLQFEDNRFVVKLGQPLDRENRTSYSLVLNTTDWESPNMSTITTVTLQVEDVNDNSPVFDPVEPVIISEGTLTDVVVIASLRARDRDSVASGNGNVTYSLPPSNSSFPYQDLLRVEQNGDLVVAQSLDREELANFFVLVKAQDNPLSTNDEQRVDYVVVMVELTDINDNIPTIVSPPGTIEIPETELTGSVVFTVFAYDNDTAPFSNVTYSMTSANILPFAINSISGQVTLVASLDYETTTSYDLMVHATDQTLTDSKNVTVLVQNINDERCIFNEDAIYFTSVNESAPASFRVFTVQASDRDTPDNQLTFSIVSGNKNDSFRINSNTGEILTTHSLDNEEISNYTLIVQCSDGSAFPTIVPLIIQVLDINDNPPRFDRKIYYFPVSENLPEDTYVDSVHAEDYDSGVNGAIVYSITSATPEQAANWFRIDRHDGRIYTTQPLDREAPSFTRTNGQVRLTIEAVDMPANGRFLDDVAIVYINITDRNDNPPLFPQRVYNITRPENVIQGTDLLQVTAIDKDSFPYNTTYYQISGSYPDAAETFDVQRSTGDIRLRRPLDYEDEERHVFEVQAIDAYAESMRDSVLVIINVVDVREENIQFNNFITNVQVQENTPVNHSVTEFSVTDKLMAKIMRNFDISFSIIDLLTYAPSEDFGLKNNSYNSTLIVYVKHNLDRETLSRDSDGVARKRYNITASSMIHGSVSAILTITILDDNDNHPNFSMPSYTFNVEENNDISVSIGTIFATDDDFGTNGSAGITYQVNSPLFQVAVDGELTSTESLDFERQQSYDFVVTASDGGTPPETGSVSVHVNVRDLNDNSPTFFPSNNITLYIGEEKPVNSVVVRLNVRDLDSGRFGEVNVSMGNIPSQHFEVTPNGSIILIQSLDRETVSSHYFTVEAIDGGGEKSIAEITINVEDFNDNKPVFNPTPTIIINEDQPAEVVFATITASDDDVGPNGMIRYAIGDFSLSQTFCIDEVTGGLSLCNQHGACMEEEHITEITNYEHRMKYILNIVAYDLGTPRNIVSKNITILINPINEHTPMFDRSLLFVYINETRESNIEVVRIRAVDADKPEAITYQVNGTDRDLFRYDPIRGAVISNGNIDYNIKPSYNIMLTATDSGGKSDSVDLIILVVNTNDHPPVFDQSSLPTVMEQPLKIKESTPVSTVVWRVLATDEDDSNFDAVRYRMVDPSDDMKFRIDVLTGEIIVNRSLDYEERNSYNLVIQAVDAGTPPLTSSPVSIWIRVTNENDEMPVFNSTSYSFFVAENTPANAVVGTLYATDRDSGTISYSIVDGINQYFNIDSRRGYIYTRTEIDRDTMSNNVVVFTVHATDNTPGFEMHTAEAEVTVTITDVNDNAPELTSKQYIISISPDQQPNVPISTTISSSDRDGREYSQYHYEVEGSSTNLMINVTSSGQLILDTQVPTNYQLSYSYTLRAVDNNNNSLYTTASLVILVETTNDHHPRFNPYESVEEVSELDPSGTVVIDLSQVVSDPDTGSNGQITYTFAHPYPKFNIENEIIVLNGMLDYESVTEYTLVVRATDNRAGSRRTATGLVRVIVEPGNEFPPVFNWIPYHLTLSYLTAPGLDLFKATATDRDKGEDGQIQYTIRDDNHYLTIDQESGVVRNQGVYDSNMDFQVMIEACDCGITALRTTTTVRITIRNAGTDKPVISRPNPRSIVRAEDTAVGSLLNAALITTPEAQTYHLVKQILVASNDRVQTFSVTEANGRLRLNEELDYEVGNVYSLVVEARRVISRTNISETRASDFLLINFTVTNVNDNNPVFTPITMKRFPENTAVGTVLFQAEATDRDLGPEGILTYDFCQGSTDGTFGINSTSGQVRLERSLDRETSSSYTLCIEATDHSVSPHSAEVEVEVKVLDVNDFETTYGDRNYSLSIYEYPATTAGTRVMKLSATDLDEGPPLKYRMSLLEASLNNNPVDTNNLFGIFEMDPSSGTITVGSLSLDRETVDRYLYYVTATDLINTASTYLTIHILDVDDHAPQLNVPASSKVIEGAPPGTLVTKRINVTDMDIGINGWVIFSLGSNWPGDYFRIDPLSGVIRVNRQIVATENATFTGEIIAEDQGPEKLKGRATVNMVILDVNDHPPMFDSSSITLRREVTTSDSDTDTQLYQFNVTDADFSFNKEPWMFQIPHYYSEVRSNFRIDDMNGILYMRQPQEEVKTYNFIVDVSNSAFLPRCVRYMQASSINVTVEITPLNMNAPQFTMLTYTVEVVEGFRDFSEAVTRFQATDADGDYVMFSILENGTPFHIDSNGDFLAIEGLDRETERSYNLTVIATDTGFPSKSSNTTIFVIVTDINDNSPEFPKQMYTRSVMENTPINTSILTVTAEDLDDGANGQISYRIENNNVPFSISQFTGNIVVSQLLDYESTTSYLFKVIATDSGNPARTSSTSVNISLEDVNDSAPRFVSLPQDLIIVYPSKNVGDVIYTVEAIDPDQGGDLTFSFVNQQPKCYFDINSRTGEITLKEAINSKRECSFQNQKSQSDPMYFIIAAEIRVSDGQNAANTTIDFSLHHSFGITVTSTQLPIEIISASVLGVLIVTLIFVIIVIIACVCRWRKAKYVVGDDNTSQSMEMRKRFGSTRSHTSNNATGSIYKQTTSLGGLPPEHTTVSVAAGSSTSSARQSFIGNGDSESGGAPHDRTSYHSPATMSGKSQTKPYRSTSDLGSSTMNTDILSNGSQEAGPYHKAQLERIYAKNADLLDHSGSNESIHMFGSEGGGESDGGDDLYSKFDDLDDDDDSTTMQDDEEDDMEDDMNFRRRSVRNSRENVPLNIDPVEIPYGYSHDPMSWTPRATNMAETIDQIAYESEEQMRRSQHFVMDEFSKSQGGMSGYGTGTQESIQPLLRHQRHHVHHHQPQRHMMQQQPDYYYDDRGQDMRLHDDHHIMRGPPPNYSGSSSGLPSYSVHDHHPVGRHPGGSMGVPSIRGASQEVPPMYSYHEDFMHHPMHHDMSATTGTHSPSSTPTEEALNTRNEYESDIMYSSDTSLNTNTENEQLRQQQLHQQMRAPRGFSQSSQRGFSQSSTSQRHAFH